MARSGKERVVYVNGLSDTKLSPVFGRRDASFELRTGGWRYSPKALPEEVTIRPGEEKKSPDEHFQEAADDAAERARLIEELAMPVGPGLHDASQNPQRVEDLLEAPRAQDANTALAYAAHELGSRALPAANQRAA